MAVVFSNSLPHGLIGQNRTSVATKARRPITPHEKQLWAEMAQLLMLAGLAESSQWEARDIVFHGGTSLHLGWASPRFSEDLDFLLSRDLLKEMGKTMGEVVLRMERYMLRLDAGLRIELKDKSTSKMGRFNISISKDGVIGKSVVKSEFWGVDDSYLSAYKAVPRTPILPESMQANSMFVRLRAPLPIATLDSVFCDKLIAMAGRPYIKWRDIFDLWWISQSREFQRPSDEHLTERLQGYAGAYRSDPNTESHEDLEDESEHKYTESLSKRLRDYADRISEADMVNAAKEELQRFLVDYTGVVKISNWPEGIQAMIANAVYTARYVADLLDQAEDKEIIVDQSKSTYEPYPARMKATC